MSYESQKQQLMATAREKLRIDSVNTFQNLGRIIAHAKLLDLLVDEHCTNRAHTAAGTAGDNGIGRVSLRRAQASVSKRSQERQDTTGWAPKVTVVTDNSQDLKLLPLLSSSRLQPTIIDDSDSEPDSDSEEEEEDSSDDEFDDYDHFTSTLVRILVTWKSLRAKSASLKNVHNDSCNGNQVVKVIVTELPSIK